MLVEPWNVAVGDVVRVQGFFLKLYDALQPDGTLLTAPLLVGEELSDLMARGGRLRPEDQVMLTIEYEDPETGQEMVEERAWTLGDITSQSKNSAMKPGICTALLPP